MTKTQGPTAKWGKENFHVSISGFVRVRDKRRHKREKKRGTRVFPWFVRPSPLPPPSLTWAEKLEEWEPVVLCFGVGCLAMTRTLRSDTPKPCRSTDTSHSVSLRARPRCRPHTFFCPHPLPFRYGSSRPPLGQRRWVPPPSRSGRGL